jgi:hypothetical protein
VTVGARSGMDFDHLPGFQRRQGREDVRDKRQRVVELSGGRVMDNNGDVELGEVLLKAEVTIAGADKHSRAAHDLRVGVVTRPINWPRVRSFVAPGPPLDGRLPHKPLCTNEIDPQLFNVAYY